MNICIVMMLMIVVFITFTWIFWINYCWILIYPFQEKNFCHWTSCNSTFYGLVQICKHVVHDKDTTSTSMNNWYWYPEFNWCVRSTFHILPMDITHSWIFCLKIAWKTMKSITNIDCRRCRWNWTGFWSEGSACISRPT